MYNFHTKLFFTANGNLHRLPEQCNKVKKSHFECYSITSLLFTHSIPFGLKSEHFMTPPQFIQDLGASYIFPNKRIVVSFDAKNIFKEEAYEYFCCTKTRKSFLPKNWKFINLIIFK